MKDKLQVIEGGQSEEGRQPADLTDDELMLLAEKRPDLFEILVARHQSLVLAYATRFIGSRPLAEEVTQEVFLTLWVERKRYRPRGKLRSYLLTIAINRCRAALRKRRSEDKKVSEMRSHGDDSDDPSAIEQLLRREHARQVQQLLLGLSERYREALVLRFCSDLSYDEMAAVTGKPEGTLKALVSRGLKQLHRQLYLHGRTRK
jgi:RNA polymerase sigma-70 factor (ECF subfamily)